MTRSSHEHQDKILGQRFSTGKNILGEQKTASIIDLICTVCNQKTIRYEKL